MTAPDGRIRVLIVDDQSVIRAGFRAFLGHAADIQVIGEAADGAEALSVAGTLHPDVVLMDIRMPVLDGLTATGRLLDRLPQIKVIILTTFDLDEYVFEALRLGASGFLLKDTSAPELARAVRTVRSGAALLAPQVTRRVIATFASTTPSRTRDLSATLGVLTEREREVLELIARGQSNSEIAGALYISEATAKTHVSNLLSKLQLRDRVQAVVLAYESGLVTPGTRPPH